MEVEQNTEMYNYVTVSGCSVKCSVLECDIHKHKVVSGFIPLWENLFLEHLCMQEDETLGGLAAAPPLLFIPFGQMRESQQRLAGF